VRRESQWPLKGTVSTALALNSLAASGSAVPTGATLADLCTQSFVTGATGTDLRGEEAGAITLTSPVLTKNLEITGPIALKLKATATTTDFDWVVRLTDVAPDGSSNWISDGRLRAALRDGLDRAVDVPVAQPVDYAVDISPTSAIFRTG